MHSSTIFSFLAAAVLATAAPSTNQPRSAFYVCANNNFRGDCTVDPCALPWCPDYNPGTYEPVTTWDSTHDDHPATPAPAPSKWTDPTVCPVGTGFFQACANNGFRGCCKTDACSGAWCPDYKVSTYEPANTWVRVRSDPTVCAAGTGFFQVCAGNGFRGCCKGDACGGAWCPDYEVGTYEPAVVREVEAEEPKPVVHSETGYCPAGAGYYQVCANGFKGCCKADACSIGSCPY